ADQAPPLQWAMWFAGAPADMVKSPPAMTSSFDKTARAATRTPASPVARPAPSGVQAVPSHRAILAAATPPACAKYPPAMRSPLGAAASAVTELSTPVPSGDQAVPFQRAMLRIAGMYVSWNNPPATRSPLARVTRLRTVPRRPAPSADH